MLSESQLSALLTTAARALASSPDPRGSLIPCLCQAVIVQLKLSNIQLWQLDSTQVFSLWKSNPDQSTFSIDDESLRNIETGELQHFDTSPLPPDGLPQRISLTSVLIVDSAQLTVAFQHSQDQNLDDDIFQVSEILADIRRRELLQKLFDTNQNHSRVFNFLTELLDAESEDELLQIFATDGVAASDFDRILIVSRQGSGAWDVSAVSGVDSISDRSDEVQRIRSEIAEAEENNSNSGNVFPLSSTGEWSTARHAVVFEKQQGLSSTDQQSAKFLAKQLALALTHVSDQSSVKRRKRSPRDSFQSSLAIGLVLIAASLLMLFWQVEFKIKAFGQAVPQQRQEVFAPERGIIQDVKVKNGAVVEAGDVLFVIYNDEHFLLRETTREELVTAESRLAALQTLSQRKGAIPQGFSGSMPTSVEQTELEKKIESLQQQLTLIDQQLSKLNVVAPFAGQVFRERMQEELLGRPVQQGQYILQIAAINGPWELQLRVPENEIRHVLSASASENEPLAVSFALETAPEIEHQGTIDELSQTTDLDQYGVLSTQVVSHVNQSEIPDARFGAGVLAKIHCGHRSLGYIATRRLIEFWSKYSPF